MSRTVAPGGGGSAQRAQPGLGATTADGSASAGAVGSSTGSSTGSGTSGPTGVVSTSTPTGAASETQAEGDLNPDRLKVGDDTGPQGNLP